MSYVEHMVLQRFPTHSSLDFFLSVTHTAFGPAVAQLVQSLNALYSQGVVVKYANICRLALLQIMNRHAAPDRAGLDIRGELLTCTTADSSRHFDITTLAAAAEAKAT